MKATKKLARRADAQLALSKQTACSVRLSSSRSNNLFVTSGHLLPTIQRLFVSQVIMGNPVETEADSGAFFCLHLTHLVESHTRAPASCSIDAAAV